MKRDAPSKRSRTKMVDVDVDDVESSRRNSSPTHLDCTWMDHEDDILCGYEGGNDASYDTASLSLTQEGSLLSSFSNDTQEDVYVLPLWQDEPLRHRRTGHCEYADDYMIEEGQEVLSLSEDSSDEDMYHYKEHYRPRKWLPRKQLKARLLLAVALCATLIVGQLALDWACRYPRWKLPSRARTATILEHIKQRPVLQNGMTLRIRGSHVDLVTRSLDQHANCPLVKHVQIDWTAPHFHVPTSVLEHSSSKVQDLSTNPNLETEAIMMLDEGVLLSCDSLKRAWGEWKNDPTRLVGFMPFPRSGETAYSLVSDSAALFHRFYLRTIEHATLSPPCQHLALSAWVTAISHQAPIAMAADPILLRKLEESPPKCNREALQATGLAALPVSPASFIGGYS